MNKMNTVILIVVSVVLLVIALVAFGRRTKPTGDKRYTLTRRRGGRREVYDSETNTWLLIDTSCYNDINDHVSGGSSDYSSNSYGGSSSYDSGSSFSSFSGGYDSSCD